MAVENRKAFKRILCPLDFVADSDEALRYAIALARTYGAKLYVCHCMEAPDFYDQDKRIKAFTALYAAVGRHILPGRSETLDWEPLVLKGDPTAEIPRQCAKHMIDLLVMRSRRKSGLAGALGSTAEALVRTSPCSVLVTGPNEREFAGKTTNLLDPRRILVAYDFTPEAEDALSLGISFARQFHSALYLMHVLRYATVKGVGPIDPAEPDLKILAGRLSDAVPAGTDASLKIDQLFAEGDAAKEILHYADAHPIDLICMGAVDDDSLLYKLLGSTANRVLRGAPCPVLIARHAPALGIVSSAALHRRESVAADGAARAS